ncbi:MAG: hypothetical protein M1838_004438 [Thelocarpon superellum]|nr:MAG: hypothetical protein M1838_004438 [Thelocarpon superellum]
MSSTTNPTLKRPLVTGDKSISPPPGKRKILSTTTKTAVAGFFTPASKKEPEKLTWHIIDDSLLIGRFARSIRPPWEKSSLKPGNEQDSTLIKTKQGQPHARDAADWTWWHPGVPGKLKDLHEKGFEVVVLSNQGGISLKNNPKTLKGDMKRLTTFKEKVSAILQQLDFPINVYAATSRDRYRKPRLGMWKEMLEEFDLDMAQSVDAEKSFFVGDAGGRSIETGATQDHSSSDRDFAANIGISFHTPEEYFLQEEARPFTRTFDPAAYLLKATATSKDAASAFAPKHGLEIVLFCGSPGAGKSTFYREYLKPHGYERVNQDTLKTRDKCLAAASDHLSNGKSVAVDNTNADVDVRAKWVGLAHDFKVPIRCIYFTAPPLVCQHNDAVRALNGPRMNPESRTMLPSAAFRNYLSRFQPPKLEEGFEEIIPVVFQA